MLNIKVSGEDILEGIDGLSNECKLEFIKAIDSQVQDWEFIQICFEYFSKEMLQYFDSDSFENGALRTLLLTMEG